MFRIGWEKVDATLIDQKLVRKDAYQSEMGGRTRFQVWDYMVELPGRDGTPTRLVIREKSFEVELPPIGGIVPVRVNKRHTKAEFDLDDARISTRVKQKQAEERRKQRQAEKEARFERRLKGDD